MIHLRTFEELSENDYRNEDPISKLKMIELVYNTIMDNGEDGVSLSNLEDRELNMESAEINFKYKGVPFKLSIERVEDGLTECSVSVGESPTLPRKSTVKKIKKLGKKSGVNKSTSLYGGNNSLKGKISSYK